MYIAAPAFTATAWVTGPGGLDQAVTPVVYGGDCTNVTVAKGCWATATFAGDATHLGQYGYEVYHHHQGASDGDRRQWVSDL